MDTRRDSRRVSQSRAAADPASREQAQASWTASRVEIDTSVAHPARRYDYWLGGKDHFAADRESGDALAAVFPTVRTAVVENRRFLGRAVRFLAEEAGIDQYLDIGTGIPAADNTHEVAQRVNPASRVVYVDNDPIVLAHARALLTTTNAAGATAYLDADLRRPEEIIGDPVVAETLDLRRPVALMLVAVLHFLTDADRPKQVVARLLDALPPGSYLVMSHGTHDHQAPDEAEVALRVSRQSGIWARSRAEFDGFFAGLDVVVPGVVSTSRWRADAEPGPRPGVAEVATYAAVGRKP